MRAMQEDANQARVESTAKAEKRIAALQAKQQRRSHLPQRC